MADQIHVTQGQQSQGFGHVNPAGQVTQVPLSPGGGESWPGYQGPETPPAIYLEPQVTSPPTYATYRQRASAVLGALQITAALVSVILNIAGIVICGDIGPSNLHYFGYGIWCSLFYIISGSLAIKAGKRAKRRVVIGSTVASTMSVIIVWFHISFALTGIAFDVDVPPTSVPLYIVKASLGLNSTLLIIGILEFIVSVWTASLGCFVTCCGPQATEVVTQTKVVYVQGPQQHSGHDGNTQRLGPGNPSSYPTYSTPSPEEVYDTIPDDIPEVSTTDAYFTIDHSSPAETNPYIQVIDQPDVGGVPPSTEGVYLQPETGTIPDVIPEVSGPSLSRNTTDVYLTTDHSSPAERHHYIHVLDQPDVGGVPSSSDGVYLQPTVHFNHPQGVDTYLTTNTATEGNR